MLDLRDIIGQDAAVARLQQAMAGDRVPHAYLFAGPDGVGRRTSALALARTLLCEDPQVSAGRPGKSAQSAAPFRQACGGCASCRMMDADSHPDFHLVYKELARYHDDPDVRNRVMQELSIDVIRSFLIAPAGRSGTRGRGKVFVVLEAERMSVAAQNALLKTLEEPPDGVTIVLICRRPEQMLPTTRSRCAMVRFGPLPGEFVQGRLIAAGVGPDEARFWSVYTDGAVGRALRLAEQGMYAIKCDILDRLAALGPAGDAGLSEHLAGVMDRLAREAVADARKSDGVALSKQLASRSAASAMLEMIASAFCDALRQAVGAGVPAIHPDQPQAVAALAERFGPDRLAEVLRQLSEFERLLWRNVSPKTVWDNVVITCASAAPLRL